MLAHRPQQHSWGHSHPTGKEPEFKTLTTMSREHTVSARAGLWVHLCVMLENQTFAALCPASAITPALQMLLIYSTPYFLSLSPFCTQPPSPTCPQNTPPQTDALDAPSRCLVSRQNKYLINNSSLPDALCPLPPSLDVLVRSVSLPDSSLGTRWPLLTFSHQGSETRWSRSPE